MSLRMRSVQLLLVFLLVCVAFGFRVSRLDDVGLAEDEVHKVLAVQSYINGDFIVNAEHPMVMKLAATGMFVAADWWNQKLVPAFRLPVITPEFAVRFPNALVGSLTTIVLFLLARTFLGAAVALLSAAFWAVGINAITYNRIAKEDTFLVFFLLLGFFLYQKAKAVGKDSPVAGQVVGSGQKAAGSGQKAAGSLAGEAPGSRLGADERARIRWYALSGAAFGLAFASKYFPHYLGLLFLFYYLAKRLQLVRHPHNRRTKTAFWVSFFAFFVLFNPVVLHPETWGYLVSYVSGKMMNHHGYQVMGRLYRNEAFFDAAGMPIYFYVLYLLVKAPVPLLLLLLFGVVQASKRYRQNLGHFFVLFMFLTWIVLYSLVGGKWLRYTLSLTPWLYMLAAMGLVWALGVTARWLRPAGVTVQRTAACLLVAGSLYWMTAVSVENLPYYSLYVNRIGGGMAKAGSYFPHDEFYDLGLREAVAYVARSGPQSSAIYSDADELVKYYALRFGRPDLQQATLCEEELEAAPANYILVQDGRRYFENAERIDRIERTFLPEKELRFEGIPAVRIYRVPGALQARARHVESSAVTTAGRGSRSIGSP